MRALFLALALLAAPVQAEERIRVATYHVGMARGGAGVLLRDLRRAPDAQIAAALAVIRTARPDILLLNGIDHDAKGRALDAFRAALRDGPDGIEYPQVYNGPINAGEPSGFDLDGDGLTMGWADNWGWGKFPGNGGMALLSMLPIEFASIRTFNTYLWADLPGADLPRHEDGRLWPDPATARARRLASTGFWDVPIRLPDGPAFHVLASNPTPPLFDGPERSNAKRNRDEIRFWAEYLSGTSFLDDQGREAGPPETPVIVLGNLNKDPNDGAGEADGIAALLESGRLNDVRPSSRGALEAAKAQAGQNLGHATPPELDTADWRDDEGPGNLRVDYVLPDVALRVTGSGVFWPHAGSPEAVAAETASAHRLVWVDITLP